MFVRFRPTARRRDRRVPSRLTRHSLKPLRSRRRHYHLPAKAFRATQATPTRMLPPLLRPEAIHPPRPTPTGLRPHTRSKQQPGCRSTDAERSDTPECRSFAKLLDVVARLWPVDPGLRGAAALSGGPAPAVVASAVCCPAVCWPAVCWQAMVWPAEIRKRGALPALSG
jgi:hypothetical protein